MEEATKSYIESIINDYEADLKIAQIPLEEQVHEYSCLETIKYQTPEIHLAAVKQFGLQLEFIEEQKPEIVLAALNIFGCALKFVKEQTYANILVAVKNNGLALRFAKRQKHTHCLAAVKENGYALLYVNKQTRNICIAAIQQEKDSFQYIRDPNMKLQLILELFNKYKHLDYTSHEIQFCIARMKEL